MPCRGRRPRIWAGHSSIGASSPCNPATCGPIRHIVIIVKENRSFDNIFGQFPGADGTKYAWVGNRRILMPDTPDSLSFDIAHGGPQAIAAVNNGRMNQFYLESHAIQDSVDAADSEFRRKDIPAYYTYAGDFALADHFFSNVLGPSFPNHLALITGNTFNLIDNPQNPNKSHDIRWGCDGATNSRAPTFVNGKRHYVFPCFNTQTLTDEANAAGVSWRDYALPRGKFGYVWNALDAIKHIRYSSQWHTK